MIAQPAPRRKGPVRVVFLKIHLWLGLAAAIFEILNRLNQVASTGLVQLNERVAAGELNPVKAQ